MEMPLSEHVSTASNDLLKKKSLGKEYPKRKTINASKT
jgi:hypothetical protein